MHKYLYINTLCAFYVYMYSGCYQRNQLSSIITVITLNDAVFKSWIINPNPEWVVVIRTTLPIWFSFEMEKLMVLVPTSISSFSKSLACLPWRWTCGTSSDRPHRKIRAVESTTRPSLQSELHGRCLYGKSGGVPHGTTIVVLAMLHWLWATSSVWLCRPKFFAQAAVDNTTQAEIRVSVNGRGHGLTDVPLDEKQPSSQ